MYELPTKTVEAFGAKWTFAENDFGADISRHSLAMRADAFIAQQQSSSLRPGSLLGLQTYFSSYPDVASSLVKVEGEGFDGDYANKLAYSPAEWLELGERCRTERDYSPINALVHAAESLNPGWNTTAAATTTPGSDTEPAEDKETTPPQATTATIAALTDAADKGLDNPPNAKTAMDAAKATVQARESVAKKKGI